MHDIDMTRVREIASTLAGPLVDPDGAALSRVRDRLDARTPDRVRGRRWTWLVAIPATAVAVSAGLVAVTVLRPSSEAAPQVPASSATVDVYVPPLRDDCRIAELYGPRWGSIHWGTDFACPTGTPFYAVHAGTVTRSQYETGYGLHVFLDIGDGVFFIYGHASQLTVPSGTTVEAGDLLGYVGATGNASGPHLHFEVRVDGGVYDAVVFMREHGVDITGGRGYPTSTP